MNKRFKRYNKKQRRNNKLNKKKRSYFDKLYIRIFLSSLLLLILLGSKNLFNLNIFNTVNQNMNILPIVNLFTKIYDIPEDIVVNITDNYEEIEYINGINYITNKSFNGVTIIKTGIVVKIEKLNDLYYVTIKSDDGIEYTYGNLTNLDVSIYSYVTANSTIGSALYIDDEYRFSLKIKDGNEECSLLELYN